MLTPADAEAAIREHVRPLPEITLPLAELSGAVLRETVEATRDHPPFARVMMDGVAISMAAYAQGARAFRVAGTQPAGARPLTLPGPESCIEVMTGASAPVGCDCVIPIEKVQLRDGMAVIAAEATPSAGANIHARALDVRAGARLLSPGAVLGPAEVAILASNGYTKARVTRPPGIMVISTGDELREPGERLEDWQIYRSNVYALLTALRQRGYAQLGQDHVADDLDTLRQRLREHLDTNDVLILSGGVSAGRFDYVPRVLEELGVRKIFHKIAQRPGKPMWFGVGAQGQAVYALPGNPVSTLVCLARYVLSGLETALGVAPRPAQTVLLAENVEVKAALAFFMPVRLHIEQGVRYAAPRPTRGSGDFTSLTGVDGFVELTGPGLVTRDTPTPFFPW